MLTNRYNGAVRAAIAEYYTELLKTLCDDRQEEHIEQTASRTVVDALFCSTSE